MTEPSILCLEKAAFRKKKYSVNPSQYNSIDIQDVGKVAKKENSYKKCFSKAFGSTDAGESGA